jgi:hypothetical protein
MNALLIRHDVSDIATDSTWAMLRHSDMTDVEYGKRVRTFKGNGFHLLYHLADCTVGMKNRHTVRERQVEFMEELNKLE